MIDHLLSSSSYTTWVSARTQGTRRSGGKYEEHACEHGAGICGPTWALWSSLRDPVRASLVVCTYTDMLDSVAHGAHLVTPRSAPRWRMASLGGS